MVVSGFVSRFTGVVIRFISRFFNPALVALVVGGTGTTGGSFQKTAT